MPFKKPMLSLTMPDEEEDSDDEEATAVSSGGSSGSRSLLQCGLAGLTVHDNGYDDNSPPGAKRGRGGPAPLKRQDSYDVTPTNTFEVPSGGVAMASTLRIKPEGIVEAKGNFASPTRMKTDILYADLQRWQLLGRGATSKVFLATHAPSGRTFAVKELSAMADDDTRRMAVNELRIAHRHAAHAEHLVHFVDAYFAADKICIAMEFADAGSFEDVIKRAGPAGGVPHVPLAAITLQMLFGLQYLHKEMHQVHRDLKPANVMLTRRGIAKLSDFGISKQLGSTNEFAMTQVGTLSYMAPERLRGDLYNWSSDVWAVGVIVLEAITGTHPFGGRLEMFALEKAICREAPPTPPAGTPAEIVEFVQLCLRKDAQGPQGRPPVRVLGGGAWLLPYGSTDVHAVVASYLHLQAAMQAGNSIDDRPVSRPGEAEGPTPMAQD
jgi:hypothetical protein